MHVNTVSFKADSSNAKLSIPSLASKVLPTVNEGQ
jgi:hypothetical protein